MAMSLAAGSISRPVTIWLAILFCAFGGMWGLGTVGRLEDPSFTLKTALVFVPYPGATAEEVEEQVSEVIEGALQQMQQLRRIESKSTPGMSQITVEITVTFGADEMPQVWDEMRRRISDLSGDLPAGAREPIINDDFGDVYGMFYAVGTNGYSPSEQREIARFLRRGLVSVDGVAKVEIQGLTEEEITVAIPSSRLTSLGLPPTQILAAISDENRVFADGEISQGPARVGVSVPQGYATVTGIEALRLGVPGDVGQIAVADIASVTRAEKEQPDQIIRFNGERPLPWVSLPYPTAMWSKLETVLTNGCAR